MGIVVIGAVFVDIKGYPLSTYILSLIHISEPTRH